MQNQTLYPTTADAVRDIRPDHLSLREDVNEQPRVTSVDIIENILSRTSEAMLAYHMSLVREELTEEEQDNLLHLFKRLDMNVDSVREELLDPDPERLHCLRCHSNYFEKNNTTKACKVTHDVLEEEPDYKVGDEYTYSCSSCGASGTCSSGDWPPYHKDDCFIGTHTTEEEDVSYGTTTPYCSEELGCYEYSDDDDSDDSDDDNGNNDNDDG